MEKKEKEDQPIHGAARIEREYNDLLLFAAHIIGLQMRPEVAVWRRFKDPYMRYPKWIARLIPGDGLYALVGQSIDSKSGIVHISGNKDPWVSLCGADISEIRCRVVTPDDWDRHVTCKRCRSYMDSAGAGGGKK